MKYLKNFKTESIGYDDDADTMARYQLFGVDTMMTFYFAGKSIENSKDIKILIEKYNKYYIEEISWIGGPVPARFVEFVNDFYFPCSRKESYPTINLELETMDMGKFIIGFSIIDKTCKLVNWGLLTNLLHCDPKYSERVRSEIGKYFRKEIQPRTIHEVINLLNLKIINPVDWQWHT
jgi:hypothetical protein